jgi:hypothetical protein
MNVMNRITLNISNNVLRLVKGCDVYPSVQCIPLKHIASVEYFAIVPPRVVLTYTTPDPTHRMEMEYSTHERAQAAFQQIQTGLEAYHHQPQDPQGSSRAFSTSNSNWV